MLKRLKKAFTIVELVIVIAVIAILAAVLIPTFVNVTKQAKLSNDQSQVRQMNTVAAMENATDNFVYAGDAVNALYNNGWNTSKLSTYSGGYHYAFSLKSTTWYLLDESGAAVFPDSNVDKSDLWVLYNNQSMDVVDGVTNYIAVDNVTNDQHYEAGFGSNTNINYTIDLNGGYIATSTLNNVTVKNGILVSGAKSDGDSVSSNYTIATSWDDKGTSYNNVIFDSQKIQGISNSTIKIYNTGNITFTNCVFYGLLVSCEVIQQDASVSFNNCKFYAGPGWTINAQGNLTVSNCEFTNCDRAININGLVCNAWQRNVLIENNVFNGTTAAKAIIQLGMSWSKKDTSNPVNLSIQIKNNTFNALGLALGIVRVHKESIGDAMTSQDLVNTMAACVTFENNTVDSSIDKEKYVINDDDAYELEYGNELVAALLAKFN